MSKRILLLQALSSTPHDLRRCLREVEEGDHWRRPSPDAWSPADILGHLIDVEQRSLDRLKRVAAEQNPRIEKIWPDEQAGDPAASPAELLSRFEAARARTVDFLKELSPGAWQRPAVFVRHGDTKLRFLVQDLVHHDIQHLDQLATALRDLRSGSRYPEASHDP